MLPSALAFLAGICVLLRVERLPDWEVLAMLALGLLPAWYWRRRLSRWPLLLLAGFCWAGWQVTASLALQLPSELEGQDLEVRGRIMALPERLPAGHLRLRFLVQSWRRGAHWRAMTLPARLNWYRDAPRMHAGEHWQLRVRLKRAHGLANPGGFDYERWLFAQGIRATGYVRGQAGNRRLNNRAPAPWGRLRAAASRHLQQLDLPPGQGALLRALALGDRAAISVRQWQLLQHTGTSHLMAISGLHVGLVATLVFAVIERLWRWLGGARWFPAPRVAALAAVLAALGYALLSGFQVPAQRATVMIGVWMGAILVTGEARPWRVLGVALWMILLYRPLTVLSAGFWLSFGAVATLLFLSLGRYGRLARLRQVLWLQLGLVGALTPLLWLWFQQASLSAPLANLIAVPWVSLLVVPPLLLALLVLPLWPGFADALLSLSGLSLHGVWRFLQVLDVGSAGQWLAPPASVAGLVLFTLGLLVWLLPAASGLRPLGALLVLPALSASAPRPAPGDIWLTLLDVGQGLAVMVQTQRHVLVYDAGPAFPGGFDSGSRILAPLLRQRGYRRLDRLVISHSDNDHSGGGRALYRQFPARVDAGEPAAIDWTGARACRGQPAWQWDGVSFRYLSSAAPHTGNNASCVLKITPPDGRGILLPGDIAKDVEAALVDAYPERLAARILIAPHHGSATSSSPAFVAAVRPAWVLYATGYRNRFGFPRPEVVSRYRAAGVRGLDTAAAGAVSVRIEAGQPIRVRGLRQRRARLWYQQSH